MRVLSLFLLVSLCRAAALEVGAAKRVVTPDLATFNPVYIAGFGNNRVATGVHDDLHARCMAFRAGGRPLVICAVDSIGLFHDDVLKIRERVKHADVVVTATHAHETPDTMGLWGPVPGQSGINEKYNAFLIERTAEAASEAVRTMAPATISFGKIRSPELDKLIDDTRPPVRHDSELTVLIAKMKDGKTIGVLTNGNNHPEALDSKNTLLTADYLGYFHRAIEEEAAGRVSVFCNGAVGGMQSPLGARVVDPQTGEPAKSGTFRFAELVGGRTAEFAAKAVASAKNAAIDAIHFREASVSIPMENAAYQMAAKAGVFGGRKAPNADNTISAPVGYIRFEARGKPVLEIALIPGEMYPELSVGGIERYPGADFPEAPLERPIKLQMTAPYRMLFGLANDEIGYIIPKAEWDAKAPWLQNADKRWYGEVNSVGSEAGPIINGKFAELLRKR
jgi:hypothetical protein